MLLGVTQKKKHQTFNMLTQKISSFTRNSRELLEMLKSMKKKAVVPSASQPIFFLSVPTAPSIMLKYPFINTKLDKCALRTINKTI